VNNEQRPAAEAGGLTLACCNTGTGRRRLLATFAAILAALGLPFLADPDSAEAKKGKHKKKKKGKCTNTTTSYSPESEERDLVDLINDFRAQNGRGSLVIHEGLGAAAKHHSQNMANKDYFAHKAPEKNIRCHGYSYHTYGENIAGGYESAADTFEQWLNSSGHRKMMLEKSFKEIGVGRAYNQNAKWDWYWTADFGSR
jgi:uncharacterized protein YkwD